MERALTTALLKGLGAESARLQILVGPRQVGKTTAALQVASRWQGPTRFSAADEIYPPTVEWLRTQWALARRDASAGVPTLLILDEVQKAPGWSEVAKALWDEDRRNGTAVKVVMLGSSALLLGHGATESLAGRFDRHFCTHWTFGECRDAFGWDLDRWLFLGGYPGSAALADDLPAWRSYLRDAIIEPAIARDVLAMERVTKPALLRNLFLLSCRYPAQALSYTKMLGQLHDAGNTTTLAHYLDLLERAWLVTGLEKHSSGRVRVRGSSPKLVPATNALVTSLDTRDFLTVRGDGGQWGRLVENAVGAHLLARLPSTSHQVTWWRKGNDEVDFVVAAGEKLWALEVKSGRVRSSGGLTSFCKEHPDAHAMIVGSGGVPLDEFFLTEPADLLASF